MRNCHNCGTKENCKSIVCTGDQCDKGTYHNTSICKNCYFEICACGEDMHLVSDCLNEPECENHNETKERLEHWDELDYKYHSKKVLLTRQVNGLEKQN